MTGNIDLLFNEDIEHFCVTVFSNEEFSLTIRFDLSEFMLCDEDHTNHFDFTNEDIDDALNYIQRHYDTTCTGKLLWNIKWFLENCLLEKLSKTKIRENKI